MKKPAAIGLPSFSIAEIMRVIGGEIPAGIPIKRRLHSVDLVVVANGHVDGRERETGGIDRGASALAVERRGAAREDLIRRVQDERRASVLSARCRLSLQCSITTHLLRMYIPM